MLAMLIVLLGWINALQGTPVPPNPGSSGSFEYSSPAVMRGFRFPVVPTGNHTSLSQGTTLEHFTSDARPSSRTHSRTHQNPVAGTRSFLESKS